MDNKLYLKYPDRHKNYALCLESNDNELVNKFKSVCREHLKKDLYWFHQADTSDFQMYEAWSKDENAIYNNCLKIAELIGMSLEIKTTLR